MRSKIRRMYREPSWMMLFTIFAPFIFLLDACASNTLPIGTMSGYQVSLFASGNASYQNPDAVAVDQGHVFIDYQNITEKDGSDHKSSTIVEYSMDGQRLRMFSVPGHSDGLRVGPTHILWALSNEDHNPVLTTIDLSHNTEDVKSYIFSRPPHGGGYDDLFFLDGPMYPFISGSNPTLTNGKNLYPAVYQVIGLKDGHVDVTPILMGNALATDRVTNTTVPLNEVDPDALSVDAQGDLVMVNQIGDEMVFISHPGPQQKVSRLRVGTQIDDTVWIPPFAHGRLLVVDAVRNQSYWIRAQFKSGTVYTETYNDSSIQGVVGLIDPSTGALTIVATGFIKATGLLFVPDEN